MTQQPVLSLDALRALDAIARKGSFAAAAESLYKVPSALSYTISRLESDLGVALFDRSRQRAQLTAAGELLLQQGRPLLLASLQLEEAVRQLDSGWERQLVIAVDTIVPLAPVLELVRQFHALGKMTHLVLSEQVMAGSWEALQSGRADLAIGLSGEGVSGQFHLQPMASVEFVFAIAPNHELADVDLITAAHLQQHVAVRVSDSALDLPARDSGIFESQTQLLVSSMQAKIAAQKAAVGVGFLPRHLITTELARGELVMKPCEVPRLPVPLFCGWRRSTQHGQALNWFIKQCCAIPWASLLTTAVSSVSDNKAD